MSEKHQPYLRIPGASVAALLSCGGVEELGRYEARNIVVFTTAQLRGWVGRGENTAEAMLACVLKACDDGDGLLVTNPLYWAAAYVQPFDEAAAAVFADTHATLVRLASGGGDVVPFGHGGGGLTVKKLQGYQYMLGMPRLTDQLSISTAHASHSDAVRSVEANTGSDNLIFTFQTSPHGPTVLGVAMPEQEATFWPTLEAASSTSHVACLPYEVIVAASGEVMALHGRYRLALSFPSLTMATFGKIRKAPGAIEHALKVVAKPAAIVKQEEQDDQEEEEKKEEADEDERRGQRVLSLDGGGTRGAAVLLATLGEMERRTGVRIGDMFDFIVGSSIGGFIAICLGVFGMSIVETKAFVFDSLLPDVVGAPKHRPKETLLSSSNMETALKAHLFTDPDEHRCKVAVLCAAIVDKAQRKTSPYWFTNFDLPEGETKQTNVHNLQINDELEWAQVARATMAAPGFFKPVTILNTTLMDGGLVANDASALAVSAFVSSADPVDVLVSVGAGASWEFDDRLRQHLSSVPFGKEFINAFEHQRVGADPHLAQLLGPSAHVARLNPELEGFEDVAIDERRAQVLRAVETATRKAFRGDARTMHLIAYLGGTESAPAPPPVRAPAEERPSQSAPTPAAAAAPAQPACNERVRAWYERASAGADGGGGVEWLEPEDGLCMLCKTAFGWLKWRHHCRRCGMLVCGNCSPHVDNSNQRICTPCKSFST